MRVGNGVDWHLKESDSGVKVRAWAEKQTPGPFLLDGKNWCHNWRGQVGYGVPTLLCMAMTYHLGIDSTKLLYREKNSKMLHEIIHSPVDGHFCS